MVSGVIVAPGRMGEVPVVDMWFVVASVVAERVYKGPCGVRTIGHCSWWC